MFKYLFSALMIIVLFLQYRIWFAPDGVKETIQLKKEVAAQLKNDEQMQKRNKKLMAEVKNLKHGKQAIEERARDDLGMIQKSEQFYQIVQPTGSNQSNE